MPSQPDTGMNAPPQNASATCREGAKPLSPLLRSFLLAAGVIAVGLGVIGLFLPVLPTVPFLLLATACFTRSSERFYNKLLDHDHLGPIVRPYLDGRGLSRGSKRKAVALIWGSIGLSVFLLSGKLWLQALLIVIALGVTCYLWRLPTAENTAT